MDSICYSQACKSIAMELENNSNMSLKEINKIISLTCSQYKLSVVNKDCIHCGISFNPLIDP